MVKKGLGILFCLIILLSCKKEEPFPGIRNFWGRLHVTVKYQDGTSGPDIPVYLYMDRASKDANLYVATDKTDIYGKVYFDSLRAGFYLIWAYQLNSDTNSTNPYAYSVEDSVWVSPDTITYKEIRLKP